MFGSQNVNRDLFSENFFGFHWWAKRRVVFFLSRGCCSVCMCAIGACCYGDSVSALEKEVCVRFGSLVAMNAFDSRVAAAWKFRMYACLICKMRAVARWRDGSFLSHSSHVSCSKIVTETGSK